MKKLILILGLLLPLSVLAQPFYIDWHKVSGGGGVSTGGAFSLSGTIGQHDASTPMTNSSYVLTGGFWALYTVQTPGAPKLSITLSNGQAKVYWPSPSIGYSLQSTTNILTPNWITPPQTVTDTGVIKYILVNPPAGNNFYRLVYP